MFSEEAIGLVVLLTSAFVLGRYVFVLGAMRKVFNSKLAKQLLLGVAACISIAWSLIDQFEASRALIVLSGVIGLVWAVSIVPTPRLYPQYFTGKDFQATGAIKIALVIMLCMAPVFPAVFLPLFTLTYLINQGKFALVSTTELLMPQSVSILLCSYFCISLAMPISDEVLLIAVLAVAGSQYFYSGVKKFWIGWGRLNVLGNIAISARTQSSWGVVSDNRLIRTLVYSTGFISQPAVIIIEIVAVICFVDWRVAVPIVISLVLLHLMIFLTTGVFFWKWIITLGAILVAGFLIEPVALIQYDTPSAVVMFVAALFIPFASSSAMPVLAWYDTPVSRRVSFVIRSGENEATITPYDIMPLDVLMSQARQEHYYKGVEASLDSYGACYEKTVSFMLNELSADTGLTSEEKCKQAKSILQRMDAPCFNNWSANQEAAQILNQLRYNLSHQSRPLFPNYHLWNMRKRASPDLLRAILDSEDYSLTVDRRVYFYCKHTNTSFLLDQRSVEFKRFLEDESSSPSPAEPIKLRMQHDPISNLECAAC